jgi:hypothetical protein
MLDGYSTGTKINDLATEFGIARTTVMKHVERAGAPRRRNVVSERLDEARRLYDQGWSLAKVAEHFGVDPGTAFRKVAPKTVAPARLNSEFDSEHLTMLIDIHHHRWHLLVMAVTGIECPLLAVGHIQLAVDSGTQHVDRRLVRPPLADVYGERKVIGFNPFADAMALKAETQGHEEPKAAFVANELGRRTAVAFGASPVHADGAGAQRAS